MEHLGDAYLKANHKQKALASYESALGFDPGNTVLQSKLENLREELKASAR